MDETNVSHRLRERLATIVIWTVACIVCGAFLWILIDILRHGLGRISLSFLTETPRNGGREGGILSIIVSTLWIVGLAMLLAVPPALGTALLLAEYQDPHGRFGRMVRQSLDALAAVPSIVFGLFGSAFFCVYLGFGFSILAGAATLACMILPILIRTTEMGLRSVPQSYRQASAALGISRSTTIFKVLLPAAAPALVAGTVLGLGRAMAETAALIFTSGYVDRMPETVMDSGRAMSVHIYDLTMNVPGGEQQAYATALVLLVLLLMINGIAGWIGKRGHEELEI